MVLCRAHASHSQVPWTTCMRSSQRASALLQRAPASRGLHGPVPGLIAPQSIGSIERGGLASTCSLAPRAAVRKKSGKRLKHGSCASAFKRFLSRVPLQNSLPCAAANTSASTQRQSVCRHLRTAYLPARHNRCIPPPSFKPWQPSCGIQRPILFVDIF